MRTENRIPPREDMDVWVPELSEIEKQHNEIIQTLKEIGKEKIQSLMQIAARAKNKAWAPYTLHCVGAAILTESGACYSGFNHETATLTETVHAEHHAILQWLMHGSRTDLPIAIAIMGPEKNTITGPCGGCRQVMLEHFENILIILKNGSEDYSITNLKVLSPLSFNPKKIRKE